MGTKRGIDDPTMSDNTILMSVEDLISIALGPSDKNTVNFKLLQAILHILARQMRILGTNVELRVQEIKDRTEDPSSPRQKDKSKKGADKHGKAGEKGKEKSGKEGNKSGKESTDDDKEKDKKERATKVDEDKYKGRDKTSATSIAITEEQRDTEKVLIVEKGPPSLRMDSKTKVGSIEVVTQSQLDELKAAINELKSIAGPIPIPELPDNEKLRSDLAKGNASLNDTMHAMQVTARLKAAEETIGRMAGLLTALSAAGALPQELLDKFGGGFDEIVTKADIPADGPRKSTPQKSVAVGIDVDTDARSSSPTRSEPSRKSLASKSTAKSTTSKVLEAGSLTRQSVVSKQSITTARASALVTRDEMNDALEQMKDDITKNITNLTTKPTSTAEMALNTTRVISERMEVALKLNARISTLNSMVSDYAEQLSGFDTGLTSQMASFQEQMTQIRADLKDGLKQLDQVNNNAETTAILELNERYEDLMSELDRTAFEHQGLVTFQKQLGDDLHDVLECVETLREQKADRDEVLDGLRDKAENTRLAGLLTEEEFTMARNEIDRRLEVCYDKFKRQEAVWMSALNDLKNVAETKAELMQLLGMKEDTQQELRELHEILKKLSVILGEPKAAILIRKLAKDATCGSCLAPALMDPLDANYGAPPPLPAMGPKPIGATHMETESCHEDFKPPHPPDNREHTCHRWVGGSHTLISESVMREQAVPLNIQLTPTKKYTGYGFDGRLYRLEEELQPCIECNLLKPEADAAVPVPPLAVLPEDGAGDKG